MPRTCRTCGRLDDLTGQLCPLCFEAMAAALSPSLPDQPTSSLPGTAERILVYVHRQESGVPLHHPADRRPDDD